MFKTLIPRCLVTAALADSCSFLLLSIDGLSSPGTFVCRFGWKGPQRRARLPVSPQWARLSDHLALYRPASFPRGLCSVLLSTWGPSVYFQQGWRGHMDSLEEEMATHSSILAGKIPWTEDPGRLQPGRVHGGRRESNTTEK